MADPTKKLTAYQGVRKREILISNFLGGIAWGLGSVIGATIIVAILVWVLTIVGLFDFVKDYFPQTSYSRTQQPRPTPQD